MRLTILSDGSFEQCIGIIGKIVEGTAFKNFKGEVCGYDVPVTELVRVGATFKLEEWAPDATLFFSSRTTQVSGAEIEVLQDEYR